MWGGLTKDDPDYVRSNSDRKARREAGVAGSYNHATTAHGNLRSNESFIQMIENLGDAYEMAEEMYGMIWWLAHNAEEFDDPATAVEAARQNYTTGLNLAKGTKNKRKSES